MTSMRKLRKSHKQSQEHRANRLAAFRLFHKLKRMASGVLTRKLCTVCKIEKPVSEFYKVPRQEGALRQQCKRCRADYYNAWRKRNHTKALADESRRRAKNHESLTESSRRSYAKHREKRLVEQRVYHRSMRVKNRDFIVARERKYYRQKRSRPEYVARINALARARHQARRADVKYILIQRMRSHIKNNIKGIKPNARTQDILCYSMDDLKRHIEKQFLPGMNWTNMGKWHIDHIVPISAYNFTSAFDLECKRCWALSNLRPLWAFDNISKNDKRTHLI